MKKDLTIVVIWLVYLSNTLFENEDADIIIKVLGVGDDQVLLLHRISF